MEVTEYLPQTSTCISSPGSVSCSLPLLKGITDCLASVQAAQSENWEVQSTVKPVTNCLSDSLQRPEKPMWPKQQCHTFQLLSCWIAGREATDVRAGRDVLIWISSLVYRKRNLIKLFNVNIPFAIMLPNFEIKARSWPVKSPPLAIQHLRENKLFQFLDTYKI